MDGLRDMEIAESRFGWQMRNLSSSACHIVEFMAHKFGAGFPSQLSSGKVCIVKNFPGALAGFPAQHILDAASKLEFVGTTPDSCRGMMQPPKLGLDTREIPSDAYADSYQCCSCRRLTPYTCDICDDAVCELCIVDDDGSLVCPWCLRHLHAHDDPCFSFGADDSSCLAYGFATSLPANTLTPI